MKEFDLKKYLAEGKLLKEEQVNNKYVVEERDGEDSWYMIDKEKALQYLSQFDNEEISAEHFINDDEGWGEFEQYLEDVEGMSDEELEEAMRSEMSFYYFSDGTSINEVEQSIDESWIGDDLEKRNEALYDTLVASQGSSETIEGEILRAVNKLAYRFYNDGDKFYEGYGTETVGGVAVFLKSCPEIPSELKSLFSKTLNSMESSYNDTAYEKGLKTIVGAALDFIESKEGNYTPTQEDMLNYESEWEEEEEDDDYDFYNEDDEDEDYDY